MGEASGETQAKRTGRERHWPLLAWVALLFGVWALMGFVMPAYLAGENQADQGALGDSFGMVNALFSGLAFLGLIYTIQLQRHEFRAQLKEYREQTVLDKEGLEVQKKVFDLQVEAQRENAEIQKALLEAQLDSAKRQADLWEQEREQAAQARQMAVEPMLMLRVGSIAEPETKGMLYNGGAPIFDLMITGGQHEVTFEGKTVAEELSREKPLTITITRKGMSGPLISGDFTFQFIKLDKSGAQVRIGWDSSSPWTTEPVRGNTEVSEQ